MQCMYGMYGQPPTTITNQCIQCTQGLYCIDHHQSAELLVPGDFEPEELEQQKELWSEAAFARVMEKALLSLFAQ